MKFAEHIFDMNTKHRQETLRAEIFMSEHLWFNVFYLWSIPGDHETWLECHFGNWKSSFLPNDFWLCLFRKYSKPFDTHYYSFTPSFPHPKGSDECEMIKKIRFAWVKLLKLIFSESFCLWNNRFLSTDGWCLSPSTNSESHGESQQVSN